MENRKNFETATRVCGNICTEDLFFLVFTFLFRLIHTRINFSCPPKFISATPPQSRYPGAGLDHMTGRPQTGCAYSLYLHPSCVQILAFHVQQIHSYKRSNKFSRQKWQFFLKFRVPKSRLRELGSSKLPYMMLLIIVMLYSKFNFLRSTVF